MSKYTAAELKDACWAWGRFVYHNCEEGLEHGEPDPTELFDQWLADWLAEPYAPAKYDNRNSLFQKGER